jgi:hypothetical protein
MLMRFRQILLRLAGWGHTFPFVGVESLLATIFLIFIESAKITDRVVMAAFSSAVGSGKPPAE